MDALDPHTTARNCSLCSHPIRYATILSSFQYPKLLWEILTPDLTSDHRIGYKTSEQANKYGVAGLKSHDLQLQPTNLSLLQISLIFSFSLFSSRPPYLDLDITKSHVFSCFLLHSLYYDVNHSACTQV